jgi:DNA-binding MarR family transcriptional regulator
MMSTVTAPARFKPVSDVVVLAAIERAECHLQTEDIAWFRIPPHLGFAHNGWTTRNLRPQVDALEAAGLLKRSRVHSRDVWGLTGEGRRRLAQARRAGEAIELHESPQHQVWRHARETAAGRIEFFREQVRRTLEEAGDLLDDERAFSDAWFVLAERLRRKCEQLGGATHCLYEWGEPDDARADVDNERTVRPRSRRNTAEWEAPGAE